MGFRFIVYLFSTFICSLIIQIEETQWDLTHSK
jgi:hypothetical protein